MGSNAPIGMDEPTSHGLQTMEILDDILLWVDTKSFEPGIPIFCHTENSTYVLKVQQRGSPTMTISAISNEERIPSPRFDFVYKGALNPVTNSILREVVCERFGLHGIFSADGSKLYTSPVIAIETPSPKNHYQSCPKDVVLREKLKRMCVKANPAAAKEFYH